MGREPGLDRKPNLKLSVWSRIQTSTPTSSMRRPPSSSPQERHHEDLIAYDACKPHTKKKNWPWSRLILAGSVPRPLMASLYLSS